MKRIRKFFYVGAISTFFDYLTYSLLIYLKFDYIVAIIIGYSIGFLINFILTRNYVFDKIKVANIKFEFILVLFISILGLILNIIIVKLLHSKLNTNYYIARVFAIGIVFFFNYYMRKGIVYE